MNVLYRYKRKNNRFSLMTPYRTENRISVSGSLNAIVGTRSPK